ncbi:MAG TPA: hypothetical protein ACQGQI_04455 [Xylella sp.]
MNCCTHSRNVPTTISSGIVLDALLTLPEHPAPEWGIRWLLRGPKVIEIISQAQAFSHRLNVAADETATWPAGRYWYQLRAEHGVQVVEVERGQMQVEPDFARLPEGYDGRSDHQRALEAIDAVLKKRATQDQLRYRINNRELWRTPIAELLKLRAFYAVAVQRECSGRGGYRRWGRPVAVRFRA